MYLCTQITTTKINIMATKKLSPAEKVAFYKANGYWFGKEPKSTIAAPLTRSNNWMYETDSTIEISTLTMAQIQDADESRRMNARKNNL